MMNGKRVLVVLVVLAFVTGIVWGADQTRDRFKDGTGDSEPDRLQLRDGSCNDGTVEVAQDAGRPDEGGGPGNGDRDQTHGRDRDGEASEPDRDQTRSRDCLD